MPGWRIAVTLPPSERPPLYTPGWSVMLPLFLPPVDRCADGMAGGCKPASGSDSGVAPALTTPENVALPDLLIPGFPARSNSPATMLAEPEMTIELELVELTATAP